MKLTNRQQEIIIDEIYNQVSKPIIEANNKALDSVKVDKNDQYLKDREKYLKLELQKKAIEKEMDDLETPYEKNKEYNGFDFGWSGPFYEKDYNNYIKHCKSQQVILKEFPSESDIEKELILSGNKDIPELIKTIVEKYKK